MGLSHHGRYRVPYPVECILSNTKMVSVDRPQLRRTGKSFVYDSVDGEEDKHAFAIFTFKYRSRGQYLHPS